MHQSQQKAQEEVGHSLLLLLPAVAACPLLLLSLQQQLRHLLLRPAV
jgi:hypothetical protein